MSSPHHLPDGRARSPLARPGRAVLLLIALLAGLSLSACTRRTVAPAATGSPASPASAASAAPASGSPQAGEGSGDPRSTGDLRRAGLKPYLRMLNRVRLMPSEKEPTLERLREVMLEQGQPQIDERLADILAVFDQVAKLPDTEYQQQRRRLAMRIRERAEPPATPAPLRLEKADAKKP